MSTNIHNPLAPQAVQGVANPGESDLSFTYVYDVTLTALQILQGQQVNIDSDADFVLRGISYVQVSVGTGGPFLLKIYDYQDFALSNGMLYNTNYSTDPSAPTVILPELVYPAGGKIKLDIIDVSNLPPNVLQIQFVGVKRFRLR